MRHVNVAVCVAALLTALAGVAYAKVDINSGLRSYACTYDRPDQPNLSLVVRADSPMQAKGKVEAWLRENGQPDAVHVKCPAGSSVAVQY